MASNRTLAILPVIWPVIWLGTAATGSAQGFNAPSDTPSPGAPPMGMAMPQKPGAMTMPGQGGSPYPQAGQPPQEGFGGPPHKDSAAHRRSPGSGRRSRSPVSADPRPDSPPSSRPGRTTPTS